MYRTYELECGAKVYLVPLPIHRSASIGFWIKTGSMNEYESINGISHFIEHMLFKGTEKRNAKAIAEFFDAIGGDLNAFTSKECTCYHAKVLDHHLIKSIEVMGDMVTNPKFSEEDIEKEKNVVIDEIAMAEDTPDDVSYDLIAQVAFGNSPLGQPILGLEKQILSFDKKTLKAFMEKFYTGDQMVISIAGSFNDEAVIKALNKSIHIPKSSTKSVEFDYKFMSNSDFIYKDIEQVHLEIAYPGLPYGDDLTFPMAALNAVLGGSVSSRLFQNIRENFGLTYSINSYLSQYQTVGTFNVYASMHRDNLNKVVDLINEEINKIIKFGISSEELTRVKEQLKGNYILDLEGSESYMSLVGKNKLFSKRVYSIDEIEEKINGISIPAIKKVIDQCLDQMPSISLVGRVDQEVLNYCKLKIGVK
jgi:predicted Zn-dependent peptidase